MGKKKILFHSNCSRVLSGFGKNTRNVLTCLHKTGNYEVVELANGVKQGTPALKLFPWRAIGTFPDDTEAAERIERDKDYKNKAGYGHLTIDEIIEKEKPDVYIGAEDLWAFSGLWERKWWRQIKTILWVTIDSIPLLQSTKEAAENTYKLLTWSNFPQEDLKKIGVNNTECIHGPVDSSNFFKKNEQERQETRKENSIKKNEFIIGFVFRNQLRKSVSNLLDGFLQFKKTNTSCNAKLLLHTNWEEGWDIPSLIKEKSINNEDVLTTYICKSCSRYEVKPFQGASKKKQTPQDCRHCGAKGSQKTTGVHNGTSELQLNEIYNMMDVYCHPFTSGGQELPIQEAKLCELITLVTDYSCGVDCSSEESGGFPLSWNEYREAGTQFIKASTYPESISSKLNKVYRLNKSKKEQLGKKAREFVLKNYSIKSSVDKLIKIIDEPFEIDWDYKLSSLKTDLNYKANNELNDDEYIIDIYKNMLKIKINKNDEVFKYLKERINKGTARDKILDALKKNASKEKVKTKEVNYDLSKHIDFNRKNKRIAIVLPKSIGDVFMATSLLEDLNRTYEGSDLYFITKPCFFEVLDGNPYIHKLVPFDPVCNDALMLEGFSNRQDRKDQEQLFNVAILLHVNNQMVLNYTRNGEDKISLDLCI